MVGAGGAGFPTHVKLNAKADTVIINGAECEPLLRVDQQLMDLQAEKLLTALDLIVDHVGAEKGVVALKEHYHAAAASLRRELSGISSCWRSRSNSRCSIKISLVQWKRPFHRQKRPFLK